jgi:hypothetical protein
MMVWYIVASFMLVGCAHGPFPYTSDQNAINAQSEMQSTVFVDVSYHVKGKTQTVGQDAEYIDTDAGWYGTGVVLSTKNGKSTILTARHVLEYPPDAVYLPNSVTIVKITNFNIKIQRLDGKICSVSAYDTAAFADVGSMVADCDAGLPVRIARRLPPAGARIEIVGSPKGMHAPHVFSVLDGRYNGLIRLNSGVVESTSVPIIGGISGSGVYYNGELVGLASSMGEGFTHTSFAVTLNNIIKYISK